MASGEAAAAEAKALTERLAQELTAERLRTAAAADAVKRLRETLGMMPFSVSVQEGLRACFTENILFVPIIELLIQT